MARSVMAAISAFLPAKSASSSMHSQPMMVESMSATNSRLRRPSSGWTQTSTGMSATAALAAARTSDRSAALRIRSAAASPRGRGSLTRARTSLSATRILDWPESRAPRSRPTRVRASCMEPRIWPIAGPTASGKSALAARLALEIGGEVVGADSMQLYRDLQVLTARPSPAELEGQPPHHLMGGADAADAWSVGRWARAAEPLIGEILARGAHAVVAGGTGLYFAALIEGLAEI